VIFWPASVLRRCKEAQRLNDAYAALHPAPELMPIPHPITIPPSEEKSRHPPPTETLPELLQEALPPRVVDNDELWQELTDSDLDNSSSSSSSSAAASSGASKQQAAPPESPPTTPSVITAAIQLSSMKTPTKRKRKDLDYSKRAHKRHKKSRS
jgi:hypothetical protein